MVIAYAYPARKPENSFHMAGSEYISMISRVAAVEEVDERDLPRLDPSGYDLIFVHPFFYNITAGRLGRGLLSTGRVVAVDVADSNRICGWCAELASAARAFVVPSYWALSAYHASGAESPGLVWPHPLDDFWFSGGEPECRELPELPRGGIRILFFCPHSFWRKGGDILARALGILSRRGVKFSLVVRSAETSGDVSVFSRFGAVFITRFLSRECLKALYAWADVVPVPSRGGGFERNAAEALACGVPALVPEVGPWMEYVHPRLRPLLGVPAEGWDAVLPGNPVHVGTGPRASAGRLAVMIERAPEVRGEVGRYRPWLRQVLGFEAVARVVERDVRWLLGEGTGPAPGRPRFRRAR